MTKRATPIVGRDRELELLQRSLEAMSPQSPQFVIITGEAGIGKSSLLTELVDAAGQRACVALEGRAAEFERELPFGLIIDAVDEYLQSLHESWFEGLDANALGALGGVFPSMRGLGSSADRPTTAAERFRVHHAVRELIEALAGAQPLVLTLDDLHWADGASLELTQYLLRRPPHAAVTVAIAYRTGQADSRLEATLETAAHESAAERIELGPLGAADVERMLDASDATRSARVYKESGGNPFYALELARASPADQPGASRVGEGGVVPTGVMAAIAGELDRLSGPARSLVAAAAVAGDPFELDLVIDTAAATEEGALTALDELTGRDLVRSTEVPRRFRFRHPLVRAAVYESQEPGSRLALHKRCAVALARRGAPATSRAHHVQYSARPGDAAAVAVLREAGEAASANAPASSARWFEAALRLVPESTPAEERVGLLMALAEAESATGRFEAARGALLEAIELTDGDEALRVQLIGACAGIEQVLGHHDEAHRRLTTALAGLPESSSSQSVDVMIRLAVGDFYRMDYEGMREWGERVLAAARPLDEPTLTAAGMAVLAVAEGFNGAIAAAETYSSQAAMLVDALDDHQLGLRLDSLANLATAELYLHRYDEAGAHAERALAIGRASGQTHVAPVLVPVLANVLHMRGRVAESAELLDGAVEAARLSGNAQALGWNLLGRSFTAAVAGDLKTALAAAEESVTVTRELDDNLVSTYAGVALANALFESGNAGRALDVLVAAAGGEELPLIAAGWRTNYLELLTRCRLALGQPVDAERAAGDAAATAAETGLRLAEAMAQRAAAAVALEGGDPPTAVECALAAAVEADAAGARVEAARARTLAGRALARAGEPDRAIAELERAAEALRACGAVRYRQEADHQLRKLGRYVRRPPRPAKGQGGVASLTGRELEVAELVVRRSTNPEIATELFISVKTVESHMRSIFRKLDVSSRVEVARALLADD